MKKLLFVLALAAVAVLPNACKHDPFVPVDPGIPMDTSSTAGYPCSPDTAYFQNQVLPLLQSQCGQSGCHSLSSHKSGVIMTDYNHVKQFVAAFNPNNSKLVKVITSTNSDGRMPPPPAAAMSSAQITLIKKWITQGALNNACNENFGGCDTLNITYSNTIQDLLNNHCNGCHYVGSVSGGGYDFTNYNEVVNSGKNGQLYGSVAYLQGFSPMPKGANQISLCAQRKLLAWIHAGMPK